MPEVLGMDTPKTISDTPPAPSHKTHRGFTIAFVTLAILIVLVAEIVAVFVSRKSAHHVSKKPLPNPLPTVTSTQNTIQKTLDNIQAFQDTKSSLYQTIIMHQATTIPPATGNPQVDNQAVSLSLLYYKVASQEGPTSYHLLNPRIPVEKQGDSVEGYAAILGTLSIIDSSTHILHHLVALGVLSNGKPETITLDVGGDDIKVVPELHRSDFGGGTKPVTPAQLAKDLDDSMGKIIGVGFSYDFLPGSWPALHLSATNVALNAWLKGDTLSPAFNIALIPGSTYDTTKLPFLLAPLFYR